METTSRFTIPGERVCEVFWAAGLILLPLTSFPPLSSISGAVVAPISILPFFILLLLWTLPYIFRKGTLPRETLPLVIFCMWVIIASAAAYFIFIPGFKGRTVPAQELRALITLLIGLIFFLVTSTWVNSSQKLHDSWKYLTIGGIIAVLWTSMQAYFIFRGADLYPGWMNRIQAALAILSPQYSPRYGRVNGLTYEASWFAHQMVMVYLPIWIAATFHKTSAFKFRLWRVSLENILLVVGLVLFFLSSPRIGLISLLMMAVYLAIKLSLLAYHKMVEFLSHRLTDQASSAARARRPWIGIITAAGIVAVYAIIFLCVFYFAAQRDYRLGALVKNPPSRQEIVGLLTLDQPTVLELGRKFMFLERAVYWMNGWNIFNQYPFVGVGLGNAGFFFPQMAPAIGWATFEIRNVLFYMAQLPNVKSFWFRLLAETGIIGFSIFITWLYVLLQSARHSQHSLNPTQKTLALAGTLSLLAFIGEGFSIDSFAMPYLWIMAGLVAAIALIYRRDASQSISSLRE